MAPASHGRGAAGPSAAAVVRPQARGSSSADTSLPSGRRESGLMGQVVSDASRTVPLVDSHRSAVAGCLQLEHFCVLSTPSEQVRVRTMFGNPPVGEDNDPIRHAHGGEPVRDEQ